MSRSTKKGPYVDEKLFEKMQKLNKTGNRKVIKTWARASVITPEFVGHTLAIHNGKKFLPIFISEQMVGHKLGEFAPTKTFKGHSGMMKQETSLV
jgi:small subunit ribosomal protein S19